MGNVPTPNGYNVTLPLTGLKISIAPECGWVKSIALTCSENVQLKKSNTVNAISGENETFITVPVSTLSARRRHHLSIVLF